MLCIHTIPWSDRRIIVSWSHGGNKQSVSAGLDGWPERKCGTIHKILSGEIGIPAIESSVDERYTVIAFDDQTDGVNIVFGVSDLEMKRREKKYRNGTGRSE